jgi:hypothetical protein
MLFGHLLAADRVHAFAPTTAGSVILSIRRGDWSQLKHRTVPLHLLLEVTRPWMWKYLDLEKLLSKWNGRTEFTVHVCGQHAKDMARVEWLRRTPHLRIEAHPCATHQVARYLIRSGKLLDVFENTI